MDFLASEDEVIGVEHLLAEPKCNDIVDCVLGFDTFNSPRCFSIEEWSAVEYGYIKSDGDALPSSLIQKEKTKSEFLDGKSEEANNGLSDGTNNFLDACEDYLLDTEFDDEVSDFNCVEDLFSDYQSAGSGGRHNGAEIVELSTPNVPTMLGTSCDQKFSLLDEMTIDELHEAFKTMFGCETADTDKEWLKHRISFGLQKLDTLDKGLNHSECHIASNENEGKMVLSTNNERSRASSPLSGVFNFKTKPRGRNVKRERKYGSDSLKTSSSEDREPVLVTRRLRRPTQRYIDALIEQNSRFQRRKCGISDTFSKDNILHVGSNRQHCHKGSRTVPLICRKEPFEGGCIQVPFGCPVEKGLLKKKEHETPDCKDNRLRGSNVHSDKEPYTAESDDDMSEDDCLTRTETHKGKSRRKHHVLWSLPEVLKLVEGVSKYGVGRWTEIKRVQFPSSEHRTSVDLKDKWRNLLRTSCTRSQSKRGVEPKRKKNVSNPIPQHILRRVRELAVMYPYPRVRTRVSPISAPTCDNIWPLSTAVSV